MSSLKENQNCSKTKLNCWKSGLLKTIPPGLQDVIPLLTDNVSVKIWNSSLREKVQ